MPPFPVHIAHKTRQLTLSSSAHLDLNSKQPSVAKRIDSVLNRICILAPLPPSWASPLASFLKMILLSTEKHSFSSK